jgi:hypothetical protein
VKTEEKKQSNEEGEETSFENKGRKQRMETKQEVEEKDEEEKGRRKNGKKPS